MLVADPDAPRGERAKLLDFGIVKVLQEAAAADADGDEIEGQTQRGMILGTPLYMAPEQWKSQRHIDGKTDVYSLAVMMFLVLTGRMPFRGADTPGLAFMHCHKAPPSLDSFDPSLPPALVELVAHMLAKLPEHRPSMEEVASTLTTILAQPAAALPVQPLLPEHSIVELIVDGEESGGSRLPDPLRAGEHPPLRGKPTALSAADSADSHTVPATAEVPGWEDDYVTTSSVRIATPPRPSELAPNLATASLPNDLPSELPSDLPNDLAASAPDAQPIRVAALPPAVNGPLPELSDHSLLVGSQYNLRPVFSLRGWVSGALLGVVLIIIGVNVLHFASRKPGAPRGPEVPSVASTTTTTTPHSAVAPVVEVQAKTHLKKDCQHMMPNAACIGGQHLTPQQQTALLGVFLRSDASLCSGDRLVLAGLPEAPRLQVTPRSMTRKARTTLLHDLKDLPSSLALPAQLEVLCPDPE